MEVAGAWHFVQEAFCAGNARTFPGSPEMTAMTINMLLLRMCFIIVSKLVLVSLLLCGQ